MRGVWAWPIRPVFDFQEVFMERIDRLIIKAKKAAQAKAERFTVGFVTYEPDKANTRLAATCGAAGRLLDAGMWLHGMTAQKPPPMP